MTCGSKQTTVEQSIPEWMSKAGQDIWSQAKDFGAETYQPYSGGRQADFSADQMTAFDRLRGYTSDAPDATGTALSMVTDVGNAAAPSLSTERIVDESGRLGAISDYINPYIGNVLDARLAEMGKAAARERIRIGDLAQSAGGYGGARHGVLEGMNYDNYLKNIDAATNDAYSSAFGSAMGMRSDDLSRFLGVDTANANYGEAALGRKFQAGTALPGIVQAGQSAEMDRINALLGAGQLQQQQEQTALDIPYSDYEKAQQDRFDKIAMLVSSIGGVPYTRSQTTTEPGTSPLGILGALLGAAF